MKIYTSFDEINSIKFPVLTIGTFDGVHVGHQKIIQQLNATANKIGGESVVFTFFPHPRMVLNPINHGIKLIQTQEEKFKKLADFGLQHLIVLPFTLEFSALDAATFVEKYLVEKLEIHTLIVGYDHQFGKNREGNFTFLCNQGEQYNFNVIEIPAQDIDSVNVSSSKIRKAIEHGDIATANHYLNEPFSLEGVVIEGKKLGRTIGFPTANIGKIDPLKLIPSTGVYSVTIELENNDEVFKGMLNIGYRPTVSESKELSVEVHLFDFSKSIYGKRIRVYFHKKVRDELRFESIEILTEQLKTDEKFVRNYFTIDNN
jgi:riboflavin kinase/FMN adenylyltransferase